MSRQLPPQLPGPPLIGHLLAFERDAVALLRQGYEKLGPIFSIRIGPKRVVVMIGREHNQRFFQMTDKVLTVQEVYRDIMRGVFGTEDWSLAAPRERYLKQRKMSLPFYERKTMRGNHLPAMIYEASRWSASLGERGRFDMVDEFRLLTMHIASRALVGVGFRERLGSQFAAHFVDLIAGVDFILPANLPIPRFIRRDRARDQMAQMVAQTVRERRAAPRQDDMFQMLLEMRDENGNFLEEREIANIIIQFVFAAHETTHTQVSWALIHLLQNPDYLALVRAELDAVVGRGELMQEHLASLVRLEYAVREAERLSPVIRMLMRYNREGYDYEGYRIPAGWYTMISPPLTHRMADIYPNPDSYDPERFTTERDPKRTALSTLIGFGGGSHKCLGTDFAITNMKIILAELLRRHELRLANPAPRPIRGASFRPEQPCYVAYQRRSLAGSLASASADLADVPADGSTHPFRLIGGVEP